MPVCQFATLVPSFEDRDLVSTRLLLYSRGYHFYAYSRANRVVAPPQALEKRNRCSTLLDIAIGHGIWGV